MRIGLHLVFTILLVLIVFGSGFTAVKGSKGNIEPYVYIENGMKHNLVVMNDAATGKKAIVDTIQHFFYGDPANDWNEIFHDYASAGDTTVNWFGLAADSATVIGILSSFYTSGTGSWDVWYSDGGAPGLPGLLPFSLPWQVVADTGATGLPSGNMQYLDIEGQVGGVNVKPPTGQLHGVWAGFVRDLNAGPQIYSDAGGHLYADPIPWYNAISTLSALGSGWWRYGNDDQWYEFTMSLVVRYEALAPLLDNITQLSDYFAGSTADKTIYADIVDLDGTVQTAELKYQIRGTGIVSTETMTLVSGDTYSSGFSVSFSAGDTVDYWIEATDNEGNFRSIDAGTFALIAPPAVGTDVFFVVDAGDGGEVYLEAALVNLSKDYYVWNTGAHGGISADVINYGFNNIVWYGAGSTNMTSPYETGANGMATYLDDGGYLMFADKEYLFAQNYANDILVAGQFGYDYLGMEEGLSDPWPVNDTTYFGMASDPISGSFLPGVDSLVTMPATLGTWSGDPYFTDWGDWVVPNSSALAVFFSNVSMGYGYYTAIRYEGAGFATAFFPMGLESAAQTQIDDVVGNTFAWFEVLSSVGDNPGVVHSYQLNQNYPNPFNPTTQISFSLKIAGNTELTIYNALGQKVITLIDNEMTAGPHNIQWNGIGANGKPVATGIYIYELKSGDFRDMHKMLFIK
jgi:hypothetical protein